MTTTAQATGAALRLARYAAVQNAGVLACPYPTTSTGPRAAARRVWLAEYLRLRPNRAGVDFGDAVTALAHGPDERDNGAMPTSPEPDLFAEVPR